MQSFTRLRLQCSIIKRLPALSSGLFPLLSAGIREDIILPASLTLLPLFSLPLSAFSPRHFALQASFPSAHRYFTEFFCFHLLVQIALTLGFSICFNAVLRCHLVAWYIPDVRSSDLICSGRLSAVSAAYVYFIHQTRWTSRCYGDDQRFWWDFCSADVGLQAG